MFMCSDARACCAWVGDVRGLCSDARACCAWVGDVLQRLLWPSLACIQSVADIACMGSLSCGGLAPVITVSK